MGSGDILTHINEFLGQINKYFNPIGKFYIQVQVLCRVLVCSVFLDDLFKSSSLQCDSKQVGCEQNCINRFAPLNHKKIWELELFMVMLAIVIFLAFNLWNEHVINREKKKNDRRQQKLDQEQMKQSLMRKSFRSKKDKKGNEFYKSNYTSMGYIFMLVFRLCFEIFFCWLENQLGKHQSQNTEFWNSFWLKESWLCATNYPGPGPEKDSLDQIIPAENRSEIFWAEDYNMACLQQKVTVTCWIPFSRMKSFGLLFMYWVLLVNTTLTALELIFELVKLCTSGRKNNMQPLPEEERPIIPGVAHDISGESYPTAPTMPYPGNEEKSQNTKVAIITDDFKNQHSVNEQVTVDAQQHS